MNLKKYTIGLFLSGAVLFSGCNDWLDVTSNTDIPSETHFSTETGFKDAVLGLYVKLSKAELYGRTLTWHVNEFVSQNYAVVSGSSDLDLPKYKFGNEPFKSYINSIWGNSYEVIANMNNILRYEERNKAVMHPIIDSLVKGETLGLRAMMHFDLLRMFGKSNLGGHPELMDEYCIPYSLHFSKDAPEQVTYREFFNLLEKDIQEALKYLEADPYKYAREQYTDRVKMAEYYEDCVDNTFLYDMVKNPEERRFRMNIFAAKALYARMLMWKGTPEAKSQALGIAEELIEHAAYSWAYEGNVLVQNNEWWKSDLLFCEEHLFTIAVDQLENYQRVSGGSGNWFDASTPENTYSVAYLDKRKAEEIFEVPGDGDSDWRFTECLLPQGNSFSNMGLVKLRQYAEQDARYSKSLPLVRISEIFYIAAECRLQPGADYDKAKAISYLNAVRNHRGLVSALDLPDTLTDAEVADEIFKEYRKEMVGEGQIFFYYKRKGMSSIPGYTEEMTDLQYQYPMPDDEIFLGGRV